MEDSGSRGTRPADLERNFRTGSVRSDVRLYRFSNRAQAARRFCHFLRASVTVQNHLLQTARHCSARARVGTIPIRFRQTGYHSVVPGDDSGRTPGLSTPLQKRSPLAASFLAADSVLETGSPQACAPTPTRSVSRLSPQVRAAWRTGASEKTLCASSSRVCRRRLSSPDFPPGSVHFHSTFPATRRAYKESYFLMEETSSSKERVDYGLQKNRQRDLRMATRKLIQSRRRRNGEGNSS